MELVFILIDIILALFLVAVIIAFILVLKKLLATPSRGKTKRTSFSKPHLSGFDQREAFFDQEVLERTIENEKAKTPFRQEPYINPSKNRGTDTSYDNGSSPTSRFNNIVRNSRDSVLAEPVSSHYDSYSRSSLDKDYYEDYDAGARDLGRMARETNDFYMQQEMMRQSGGLGNGFGGGSGMGSGFGGF